MIATARKIGSEEIPQTRGLAWNYDTDPADIPKTSAVKDLVDNLVQRWTSEPSPYLSAATDTVRIATPHAARPTIVTRAKAELIKAVEPNIIALDRTAREYFISAHEWDGYIEDVFDSYFVGIISPVSVDGNYDQDIVEIPLNILNDIDRPAVRRGAIFRLSSGILRRRSGNMQASRVYFRPLTISEEREQLDFSLEDLYA